MVEGEGVMKSVWRGGIEDSAREFYTEPVGRVGR